MRHVCLIFLLLAALAACGSTNPLDPLLPSDVCSTPIPEIDPQATQGICDATLPLRTLSEDEAAEIGRRAWDEVGHIRGLLLGDENTGLYQWQDEGLSRFNGTTDNGLAVSNVDTTTVDGATTHCVQIHFDCWTGGHGGFGHAALDGDLGMELVTVDGVSELHAAGALGLLEGGALLGAALTEVDFFSSGTESVDGSTSYDAQIGAFIF